MMAQIDQQPASHRLATVAAAAAYSITHRTPRLRVVPSIVRRGQPICPKCQAQLVQRSSRKTGDFLACPSCRHTQGLPNLDAPCPSCEKGTLIVKRLRYGPLTECDQHPICKYAVHEIEGACNRCDHTCAATPRRAARDDDAKHKGQAAASRAYRARVRAAKAASAPAEPQTPAEIFQAGLLKRYEEGE
jgi:ssDNA-binding Zn-finger/Zn-ribbon topoisomerase 1